jgi:hypothetical protein
VNEALAYLVRARRGPEARCYAIVYGPPEMARLNPSEYVKSRIYDLYVLVS